MRKTRKFLIVLVSLAAFGCGPSKPEVEGLFTMKYPGSTVHSLTITDIEAGAATAVVEYSLGLPDANQAMVLDLSEGEDGWIIVHARDTLLN